VDGAIDVTHSAIAQTLHHRIVFLASNIGMHLAEQFQRLVKADRGDPSDLQPRMIVDILAIIDRRVFDLTDRSINFDDRGIFPGRSQRIARAVFQHPAGRSQIRQSMPDSTGARNGIGFLRVREPMKTEGRASWLSGWGNHTTNNPQRRETAAWWPSVRGHGAK